MNGSYTVFKLGVLMIVAHTENLHNYKVEGHAVNILYTGKCTIVANGHLESHANFEVGI